MGTAVRHLEPRRGGHRAAMICALIIALSAALAYGAAWVKSPTYDEPLHIVAAWLQQHRGDFRVDPENPALWKYWAALPMGGDAIQPPPTEADLEAVVERIDLTSPFVVPLLFRSPETNAEAIVRRARAALLVVAVALAAMVAWWSWRLDGAVAAIGATAVFAFDPTFLAHAPLVKNDVALSLALLTLVYAVWSAGRQLTWVNAAALGVLCAVALNIKFSALVFGPIVALLLMGRALAPLPWKCFGREVRGRGARFGIVTALCAWALIASYVGTWATYGFRFAPSTTWFHFDTTAIEKSIAYRQLVVANPDRRPTIAEAEARPPDHLVRAVTFLRARQLLPEAWLTGLLFTYRVSIVHDNFFAGEYSRAGWWHYFPMAMVVKSPISSLAAIAAALLVGIAAGRRILNWTAVCLVVPPAVFLLIAMSSNLHYGVRHVLPVFPFAAIAIGLAAAHVSKRRPRLAAVTGGVLAIGLAVESISAFPHYIGYFNPAAGGSRGGLRLLGDSNLDWGQDLKLLSAWQQRHPEADLHLAYYGMVDPAYYGIRYQNLPGGLGPASEMPRGRGPGVIAISATILQGIYSPELRALYAPLRRARPIEVLGGSIYLFERASLQATE